MKKSQELALLAILNFIFAALVIAALLVANTSQPVRESVQSLQGGVSVFAALATFALFVVSGIGFLRRSYRWGYVAGIVLCVFCLGNVLLTGALNGFPHLAASLSSLIYPALLLCLLLFRYRGAFSP